MPIRLFSMTLLIFILGCALPIAAFAQDAELYSVDIGPVIITLIELIFAGLAAVALFFTNKFYNLFEEKTGIEIDDKTRSYLDDAINKGLDWAEEQARKKGVMIKDPNLQSKFVADAVQYVVIAVPSALERFDINEDRVKSLVEARLKKYVE